MLKPESMPWFTTSRAASIYVQSRTYNWKQQEQSITDPAEPRQHAAASLHRKPEGRLLLQSGRRSLFVVRIHPDGHHPHTTHTRKYAQDKSTASVCFPLAYGIHGHPLNPKGGIPERSPATPQPTTLHQTMSQPSSPPAPRRRTTTTSHTHLHVSCMTVKLDRSSLPTNSASRTTTCGGRGRSQQLWSPFNP
jgi:hypothetical protein